jgi:hypothetical protein
MATRIESLEIRRLLALATWDGGGDDTSWSNAANWAGDVLPATGDDVVINVSGPQIMLPGSLNLNSLEVSNRALSSQFSTPTRITIDTELRVGSGASLLGHLYSALTLDGTGVVIIDAGGQLTINSDVPSPLDAKLPVNNYGSMFVHGGATNFEAGIHNFGELTLHGQGEIYGEITNESSGTVKVLQYAHSPATSGGAHIKVGITKSDAGIISAAPFINRGTIRNDYYETITGLSEEHNGVREDAAGLTVFVDATPTLGGTWGAWQNALRFTRYDTSSGNSLLSVDSTFSFMHGTLYLSNVDATLSGLSSNTGLSLFGSTTATLDAPRTSVALLRVYGTSTIALAEGDRVLRAEAIEVFDNGKITIGDGLLIHGNQPGYLRFWITESPAAMPGYSSTISGSVSGSPITIEPNGNPRAVGYTDGAGLASRYSSRTFRGETFDDNDFVFFTTLRGDANFDRQVNFDDLLIVAQHYGQPTSRGYADGNFSGSVIGSGNIDFDDLLLLAQNYGQTFIVQTRGASSPIRAKRNADLLG